jgi:Zn finger protein HypA/HybF involved in hydrogenase expression
MAKRFVKVRRRFVRKKGRKPKKKIKRVCLRCDRAFISDGLYNRVCPKCTEKNAEIGMVETVELDFNFD